MVTRWVLLLPLIGLLSACATVPTGPSVMVLPAVGKPFDQFQVDDMLCRQYAQTQTGVPPGEAGTQSTVNTAVLGMLLGAGAGAAIGAAAGDAGLGAAVGAGSVSCSGRPPVQRQDLGRAGPSNGATTPRICNACMRRAINSRARPWPPSPAMCRRPQACPRRAEE